MKKILILIIFVLLVNPVFASHNEKEKEECGLTNIGQCIINAITNAVTGLLNFTLSPFIKLSFDFLETAPATSVFYNLWKIVTLMISALYTLLIICSGLYMILRSDNIEGRIKAKKYLKNSSIILILVPVSFYLYEGLTEFASILTRIGLNNIDKSFLLIDFSSISGAVEEIILYVFYLFILIVTTLFLGIRYFFASVGIVFFPIAILLYFIPFTQNYGKFLLNLILTTLFVPFFISIILAGFSKLSHVGMFQHFETLLATISFLTIDIMLVLIAFFSVFSAFNTLKEGSGWVMTYLKK